jgi:hypothetical protein
MSKFKEPKFRSRMPGVKVNDEAEFKKNIHIYMYFHF